MTQTANTIKTVDAAQFKEAVFFSLSIHRWGNRARVKNPAALAEYIALLTAPDDGSTPAAPAMIEKGTGTNRTRSAKVLLQSKALDALNTFLNDTKAKLCGQFGWANPSRIKEGLFVVGKPLIEKFEEELEEAVNKIEKVLIPAFLAEYQAAIERAQLLPVKQGGLGPIFDARDYPSAEAVAKLFYIDWQWLALGVPDDLPAQLRAKATEKLEKQFTEAAEEIQFALREGFLKLVSHAQEKLTVATGEKPKIFRDTLLGNISQFLEVFNERNIMGDTELAALVEKARQVTTGITPDKLRTNALVRDTMKNQFSEITKQLDGMITTRASRRIDLAEETDEAAAA